jgi:hypothetical protein
VPWNVEFTDQFEAWWNSLSEDEQVEIDAKVELLQEHAYATETSCRCDRELSPLEHEGAAGTG